MSTHFGIRFRYPDSWDLSEQQSENELTITVASPTTAFWSLTLFEDGPRPEELIELAVEAFRDEYEELDVYSAKVELCHRASVARDLEFVCLELLNSAFLRSFRTGNFSVLILYQGTDQELAETREVLESISSSLECDEDERIFG